MTTREYAHRTFDTDIEVLRSTVSTMAGLVERQFLRALDAIRRYDPQIVAAVLLDEQRVNQLQVESDLRCSRTIARRQPIAIDLREILAVIHIVNDLERIGDEAKKIAIRSRDFADLPSPIGIEAIEQMGSRARSMLDAAIDAFVRHDSTVAERVEASDVVVDDLRDRLIAQLLQAMAARPGVLTSGLAAVLVVQSIERVADHATNIAEHVTLLVDGVDPRQAPVGSDRDVDEGN